MFVTVQYANNKTAGKETEICMCDARTIYMWENIARARACDMLINQRHLCYVCTVQPATVETSQNEER